MLIDELIELSKHVESKEDFLKCQKKIEELEEKEKKEVLELLKQHKFNKNYLDLLFETDKKNGIGFNDMAANLKFIHAIVDDNNAEKIIEVLNENHNLYYICDENWMIEIFKYVKESNYNTDLLNLIDDYFDIKDDQCAYDEAIAVLDVIQKLNYSKPIMDYFYARYGVDNIGVECKNRNNITMLSDEFDTELFEKQNCIAFYQYEDFSKIGLLTQRYIFSKIKKLSDEQKEDRNFLSSLNSFLINDDVMGVLFAEDFTSVIDCYISLYDAMKEKNSFRDIFDYVNEKLVDNGIFQADSINNLMRLYNKHIEDDTVTEFLECKDILNNCETNRVEVMINTIENLDEDNLPVKKAEIYDAIIQGCEETDINPNELFLLLSSYEFHPDVLDFICKSDFENIVEIKEKLKEKTITTLEDEMDKCSDINEITNYLMFLKGSMDDTETLDLIPKSMIKKREYYNSKTNNETTAPVDKTEN